MPSDRNSRSVDIVVLAPLLEERAAFLNVFREAKSFENFRGDDPQSDDDGDVVFIFENLNEKLSRFALVTPEGMGRTEAAIAVTRSIIKFSPKLVIVVGVAGGFRHTVSSGGVRPISLGDVIIADRIIDLDLRKLEEEDEIIRPRTFHVSSAGLRLAREVSLSNWSRYIPSRILRRRELKTIFGRVISGNLILASGKRQSEALNYLAEHSDVLGGDAVGIEMEGVGAALAVVRASRPVDYVMIRGVSDFADINKRIDEGEGRSLAKYAAASFAMSCILQY